MLWVSSKSLWLGVALGGPLSPSEMVSQAQASCKPAYGAT